MELSGEQLTRLDKALCAAFPTRTKLARMVLFGLGENLDELTSSSSDLTDAVFELIRWARARNRMSDLVRTAIKANPDNPELHSFARTVAQFYVDKADNYCHNRQYEEAVENYTRAIELDPLFAEAYNNRGDAYRQMDPPLYDSAIADYTRAVEHNNRFAEAYNNRGNTHHNKGNAYFHLEEPDYESAIAEYTKAIADYMKALEIKSDYEEARRNLAWAHNDRGESYQKRGPDFTNDAISGFSEAIRFNESSDGLSSWAYLHRGEVYRSLQDYDKALVDFDEVIDIGVTPQACWSYFNRGDIYHEQGRYKAALNEYLLAEELGLHSHWLYYSRSKTYAALGRHEESEADYRRAREADPRLKV